jgi:hypothetical protein
MREHPILNGLIMHAYKIRTTRALSFLGFFWDSGDTALDL